MFVVVALRFVFIFNIFDINLIVDHERHYFARLVILAHSLQEIWLVLLGNSLLVVLQFLVNVGILRLNHHIHQIPVLWLLWLRLLQFGVYLLLLQLLESIQMPHLLVFLVKLYLVKLLHRILQLTHQINLGQILRHLSLVKYTGGCQFIRLKHLGARLWRTLRLRSHLNWHNSVLT